MTASGFYRPVPLPAELAVPKKSTGHTARANSAVLGKLPFDYKGDFDRAKRGFIASLDPLRITRESDGKIIYDISDFDFLSGDAPPTVNPSLWRQARLNAFHHGLYEVTDGIYQVRSFDLANMTLIRGEKGWILIDPLTSSETSRAALDLDNKFLGEGPVVAVIFTHSHADHFLGILGVLDPEEAALGKTSVLAPEHFVKEALSENILAGNVMRRRANYMYGHLLPHSPQGFVTIGLGPELSMGTTGFMMPTDTIRKTGETRVIDGIEIIFQMTPGTEAVSQFVFYLPQYQALCMSEITSHHLHNIYTLRGTQARDALSWSNQIQESIELFGHKLKVQFASHHWPTWGREAVVEYLEKQRDLYKYIHDQTLRLANHGYTKEEIAGKLELPQSLAGDFFNRDYYGTLSHNSKGVYVKYLGYFDGNPANLNPLPPVEAARRYLEYMGGAEAVIEKAKISYEAGEYRWVAQVMNHAVMAEPENIEARALLADTYEQLGYHAESGPWRNFYLCGALELRQGAPRESEGRMSAGMAAGIPMETIFQAIGIRLNGPKADGKELSFNLFLTDLKEKYVLSVKNAVFHAFKNSEDPQPSAALRITSTDFKRMITGVASGQDLIKSGALSLEGDAVALMEFMGFLDRFDSQFPIVTPRHV